LGQNELNQKPRVTAVFFAAVVGMFSGVDSKSLAAAPDGKAKVPAGTLELIRYQAERAKEHAAAVGTAASQAERAKGELQGRAEKERVEKMTQSGGSRPDVTPLSPGESALMRERAEQYAEYARRLGEAKAAQREREAEEKSAELQRQADELENQLTDENYNRNRDIKLNPVGTNLYIRNYSRIPSTVKPMRAQAASLSGTASSQQTSAKLVTDNSKAKNRKTVGQGNQIVRKTNVRGELLPGH